MILVTVIFVSNSKDKNKEVNAMLKTLSTDIEMCYCGV